MSLGLPDFGQLSTPQFNPLIYPRRIIIEVLENFFSQNNFVSYSGAPANPYLYIPEGTEPHKNSKIVIADNYSDELKKTDPRPVVILERGTLQFNDLAINSKRDSNFNNKLLTRINSTPAIGTDTRTRLKFSDIVSMPLTIKCYSRRDTEAEQLSWIIAGILKFFKEQIKEGSLIHKITSPVIGPCSQIKSDAKIDLFSIPVNFLIYQTIVWNVQNSASPAMIMSPNFANLSNYPYPKVWSDTSPLSLSIVPRGLSPDLVTRWLMDS